MADSCALHSALDAEVRTASSKNKQLALAAGRFSFNPGCLCACTVLAPILAGLAVLLTLGAVMEDTGCGDATGPAQAAMPGDRWRRYLQDDIVAAMKSGDFSAVDAKYTDPSSAMILVDKAGTRWSKEPGFIKLDAPYAVASQSKVVTALTIYACLAADDGKDYTASPLKRLSLSSRAAQYFPAWGNGTMQSKVTLQDLLSFTTGFDKISDVQDESGKPSCARAQDGACCAGAGAGADAGVAGAAAGLAAPALTASPLHCRPRPRGLRRRDRGLQAHLPARAQLPSIYGSLLRIP